MATEKETVIIDIQIDQGDSISELEKLKKGIIQSKQEVNDLTKAYKAGNITLDEYVSETVRLEGILKKQTTTYGTVQKSVTGVKTQMDKLIDSNKKISQSFSDTAKNINVAGVNIGDLGAKVTSFLNPVTAAVGIVGALGSAYARSSIGAKDLEFAQNQLSFATTILTDRFASLFSSVEDGEGILSTFTDAFLRYIDPISAGLAKVAAQAKEDFDTSLEAQALGQETINERLAKNAELLTDIANKELTIEKRKEAVLQVQENVTANTNDQLGFLNDQINALDKMRKTVADTGVYDLQINKLIAQRGSLLTNESRQREKVQKQLNSLLAAEAKEQERILEGIRKEEERRLAASLKRQQAAIKNIRNVKAPDTEEDILLKYYNQLADVREKDAKEQSETDKKLFDHLDKSADKFKKNEEKKTSDRQKESNKRRAIEDDELAAQQAYLEASLLLTSTFLGEGSAAYKALAVAQATIDTYRGATAALAPPPVGAGPIFGPALAALTIATGLANVATISGIAAAGGADFTTKGPTMLIVGDNPGGVEHVSVKPISGKGKTKTWNGGVAAAGGADFIAQGIDGGAAMNQATSEVNNSLALMNAIKNMPAPVVGVKEITKKQNSVQVKENISRLSGRR